MSGVNSTNATGGAGGVGVADRFTAKQKMEAADREVKQRTRVYTRLIAAGRMTREKAEYETEIMRAIAADYHALALKER